MLSKNKIKWIHSLEIKKYRETEKLFVAEGQKIVDELLVSSFSTVALYATDRWFKQNIHQKKHFPIETEVVTESELQKISFLKTPQEVMAVVRIPEYEFESNPFKNKLSIILDTIQDPGNLGTIIRLADWFGIGNIICSLDTADVFNPKVVQSTMGAIFRVKIYYRPLEQILPELKNMGLPIYGAALDGENIYDTPLSENGIIIMGNESKGLKESFQPFLHKKLFIPNFPIGQKNTESLNVGIATAIICAEFRRRCLN
jgi:RNA methyltransferase, TrmH family